MASDPGKTSPGKKSGKKSKDWVAETQIATRRQRVRCFLCVDRRAGEALREILEQMIEQRAHAISRNAIWRRLVDVVRGFEDAVTYRGLENHLEGHARTLWDRAKGRA